jgi:diphthine-ammonia ligase
MRFIGLISGGKDSSYAIHKCVLNGHQLVGLANLVPKSLQEEDSYMYQTVGHELIDLYSEAMDLPLFRRTICGQPLNCDFEYNDEVIGDEVEDLFHLLSDIKKEIPFDGISVGAIFSDYQRVRALNVCDRLGLQMLAPLWGREQTQLLKDMINDDMNAIIIKVAVIGLEPNKHLGKSIKEMFPVLVALKDKYGINVCGEGGEYETITLDCPLFKKRIVL